MNLVGKTHIGAVRDSNQDMYHIEMLSENVAMAVVCDGMGGTNGGNIASEMATEIILENVKKSCEDGTEGKSFKDILISAVNAANSEIYLRSIEEKEYYGMGTTVVAAIVENNTAHVVNVGDSRAYIYSDGKLIQMTTDHSFVQELVIRGEISPNDAASHPQKNLITRAVGVQRKLETDYESALLKPQELLLLCTDGLTNMCPDKEIAGIISENAENLENACDALIERANQCGGTDNITAVIIQA